MASYEYTTQDVEYLRHEDTPLLARIFTPRGEGPFPALVEVHGGAWCMSDRTTEHLRHEYMASHSIVSIALARRAGKNPAAAATSERITSAVAAAPKSVGFTL